MNKNAIVFIVVIFAMMVSFFSCVPQPVPFLGGGAIVVNFVPVFDGEAIELKNGSEHTFNGEEITFDEFKFYLSNIVLKDENGDFTDLSEIRLIEFDDPSSSTLNIKNVPLGNYKSIQFDIGVPASENATNWDPNRYGGNHPLNNESMFDQRLSSYKFLILDGNIGEGTDLKTFTYAPGDNDLFKNDKVIDSNLSLTSEIITSIDIEVNLNIVLKDIDVLNNLSTKPSNNLELGDNLMTNLRRSFSVKQ